MAKGLAATLKFTFTDQRPPIPIAIGTDHRLPFHPHFLRPLLIAEGVQIHPKGSNLGLVPTTFLVPGMVITWFMYTDGMVRLGAGAA